MEASASRCGRLPVDVTFVSTYNCNTVCEHCDIWRLKDDELTTAEVKAMVLELRSLGVRSICFDGGEPLTRPDIGELLLFCRKSGVATALRTNGILVEERISELACAGELLVSLNWQDGHAAQGLSYEDTLRVIRLAKGKGLQVAANVVLTRANISALSSILADGLFLGVEMRFRRLERYGFSFDNSRLASMMPDEEELERAQRLLKEHNGKASLISGNMLFENPGPALRSAQESPLVITPSGGVSCYSLLGSRRQADGRTLGFRAAFKMAGEACQAGLPSDPPAKAGNL